jgi:glycosyltransferase involved in cell wall biosynthesis
MMNLKEQNILFIGRAMIQGGAENVILQMCEIFKPIAHKIVVCAGKGFNIAALNGLGIKFYEIPDIEDKKIETVLYISKILRRIVKIENITVIHTHHRMAAFYVSALGLYRHCTFINTSHNTFYNKVRLTRFSYKHAHLVSCGEMVRINLREVYGFNNVTTIHNAVKEFDGNVVSLPELKRLHDQGFFLIGNIGRFTEQKGFEYFIDSMPKILTKHPMTKFILVGDGNLLDALKNRVNNIGVKDAVVWLGFRKDVQNVMSQLDLIVLSSLWEGLPLTPIEAFSVGKTIVATAVDGTVEIVRDGINGYLIPPKDSDAIADKCLEIINEDRSKLETEAMNTFKHKFSFEVFKKSLIDYYLSL